MSRYAGPIGKASLASTAAGRVSREKAPLKKSTTIRFDAEVLAALRATGDGWQTRVNDMVRASLRMAGKM